LSKFSVKQLEQAMSTLLEQAFREAQKLPSELQDEIAQQLLNDIENELKWQETFLIQMPIWAVLQQWLRRHWPKMMQAKRKKRGLAKCNEVF